jgi:hypothetical protein
MRCRDGACSISSLRLFYLLQNFFRRRNFADGRAYVPPAFNSVLVKQQRRPDSNVFVTFAVLVQEAVLANDFCAWIAEVCEVAIRSFLPNLANVLRVIHADANHLRLGIFEILLVTRELAHLTHAERSPITAIKIEHHRMPAVFSQVEGVTVLVVQREVRRGLALK